MKKLLIVLLALTVIGAFAFAQDAAAAPAPIGTFGSWNTGTAVLYSQYGTNDATTGWNNGWDAKPGIDQEWVFGYAGKDFGYSATLEFGMDNIGNTGDPAVNAPSISWFKTWYTINKFLTIDIGKPRDGTYRTQGTLVDNVAGNFFQNCKFGAGANVFPIDGLEASLWMGIPAAATKTDYSNEIAFGASYAVPKLVTVNFMYQGKDIYAATGANLGDTYMSFSASTTAVEGVTIIVDAMLPSSGNNTVFAASAGYTVPSVPVTVQADFAYKSKVGGASVNSMGVEGNVFYTMDKYNFGARIGYDDGKGVGIYGSGMSDIADVGGVLVYPYVKANFSNGSFLQIGVAYEAGISTTDKLIQIPLFYGWSF